MDEPDVRNDVRFLRDVVARAQLPALDQRWPVTLMWGCVLTLGYVICAVLGNARRVELLPWVMPVLIFAIALPLQWYLMRRLRLSVEESGLRPRFRRDVMVCWAGIAGMGLLWTVAMVVSGTITHYWYVLLFMWGSLQFVGYVMNGVLLSREWFWAAGVLLASLVTATLSGPNFYWLAGLWICGGTQLLAGLLGRANARRQTVRA